MPTSLSTPSSSLPRLSRLSEHTASQISNALDNLCRLYWPPHESFTSNLVVPTRKHLQTIHDDSVPDSGYASADEDGLDDEEEQSIEHGGEEDWEAVEVLRADPFERTFAIKWVTGFVARSDIWLEEMAEGEEVDARAEAVDKAVSVLSAFNGEHNGATECTAITRSFSFPGCDGGPDIQVELNDAPLSDEDHTSVGLQSWASSIVLAERMCAVPSAFNLEEKQNPSSPLGVRVLELGAGTGLLSITAAKILRRSKQHLDFPPVIATDFHPAVLSNLAVNVSRNFHPPSSPAESVPISIFRLDWENPDYSLLEGQRFDTILAADVIYHPEHARWIKACVERLLTNSGHFWLMMPLRTAGRHENMDVTVEETFPDVSGFDGTLTTELAILQRESFVKQRGVGRADESGYRLFKIGWVSRS